MRNCILDSLVGSSLLNSSFSILNFCIAPQGLKFSSQLLSLVNHRFQLAGSDGIANAVKFFLEALTNLLEEGIIGAAHHSDYYRIHFHRSPFTSPNVVDFNTIDVDLLDKLLGSESYPCRFEPREEMGHLKRLERIFANK